LSPLPQSSLAATRVRSSTQEKVPQEFECFLSTVPKSDTDGKLLLVCCFCFFN
jgi:hypothetical protein